MTSVPLEKPRESASEPLFVSLPASETGIDFTRKWQPPPQYEHEIANAVVGGGVTTGDYDNDGLIDVFLTQPLGGHQLYRNLGNFRFENATTSAGLGDNAFWGTGASFADVNGDGNLDLFVCGYDCPNRLYRNRGDGTFEEKAHETGLGIRRASLMIAFADYDADGDLDAYLLTNRLTPADPTVPVLVRKNRKRVLRAEDRELFNLLERPDAGLGMVKGGQADHLFRNNGDGTFTDVTRAAGMSGNFMGLSATWWDIDNDRDPDLYVANDFTGPDQLWRNNGDGTFTDVIAECLPHTPWFSMGADVADLDNDGWLDFIATDMAGTSHYKQKLSMGDMADNNWFLTFPTPRQYMRNAVYRNTGTGRFQEIAFLAGLAHSDWTWSVKAADFDADGWQDIYFTNGMTRNWFNSDLKAKEKKLGSWKQSREMWLASPVSNDANLVFRNAGDLTFNDASTAWGLGMPSVSFGASVADLDNDGDLDIVVNNFEGPATVYRNRLKKNGRVVIELEGRKSPRNGEGARVEARIGARILTHYVTRSRGFMSADTTRLHFGLKNAKKIDALTVFWPSGVKQKLAGLDSGHRFRIRESVDSEPAPAIAERETTLFTQVDTSAFEAHRERPFDDFKRQPLLPHRLSQSGPGQAWRDVDGDGDEDVYIGGAAGQSGQLWLNEKGRGFRRSNQADFEGFARQFEDMGCLFFDADGDDDNDLYVVSGGVECDLEGRSSVLLRDRLYANDGAGNFRVALDATPNIRDSGSVVCAADFDRDGDLDLFVGGRSIPGRYPATPSSRLLVNETGTFRDETDRFASGLQRTGLVTAALWTDVDADGWIDLMVTHEWGPVKFWRNESGRLVDKSSEAGLEKRPGWWNGIAGRDVDNDGDIDYVATNFGWNTKYTASPGKPALLYYGVADQSGRRRLIEAKFEDETLFPIRGRSCSTTAIPELAAQFITFHDFATASLSQIYSDETLKNAARSEVATLASGVFLNDGTGRFDFRALPRIAQVAPGFGAVLTEVNGDGWCDLFVAQNFHGSQVETGRMDGGVSQLLLGSQDGFRAVSARRSGLLVWQDAMSVALTDANQDGRPDFAVTVNGERPVIFAHNDASVPLAVVRLRGPRGNRDGVGARVELTMSDGARQTAEVHSGAGYLGQSSPALFFGLAPDTDAQLTVRWPDGHVSKRAVAPGTCRIEVERNP